MHLPQCRTRVGAEFLDEPRPHLAVGLERIGLATAPVLGQHELPGHPLVQRMGAHGGDERDQQLAVPACLQPDVVAVEHRCLTLRLQCRADVVHPRGVDGGEGHSPPGGERLVEQRQRGHGIRRVARLGHQAAEAVHVHRRRLRGQDVAARLVGESDIVGVGEQATQPGQVARQGIPRPVRRLVRPDAVDQLIRWDGTVHVDQQRDQDAALPCVADVDALPVAPYLDVAEQPELHPHPVRPSP